MADVITRLKVESSEYDSKLQRAVKGIQHLEDATRRAGKTMADASQEQVEFVRSMGNMQTVSQNIKGKLGELTKAYTELSMKYKGLTDQEKSSPMGKAMISSIDQLKGRVNDLKGELDDVNQDLNGSDGFGGVLDMLAGKLGIPTELLTKMGVAAAGVGAALKVATDAFKQNEVLMDEWGATMESVSSLYDGFLNALNTGDFGGFFRNMDNIVNAARAAYDAMDELGTFNAFNQIQKEGAKTAFTQAVADFRSGEVTKEDAKKAADIYKQELQKQADKELQAYEAAVRNLAETRNVNSDRLLELLKNGSYSDYEALKAMMPSKAVTEYRATYDNMGNLHATPVTTMTYANEMEELGAMLRLLSDDELAAIQALGAQAQRTATEIAQVDRQVVRLLGTGNQSGKGGAITSAETLLPAGSIAEVKARIASLNKELEMAADQTTRDKIATQLASLKAELAEMTNNPLSGHQASAIPLTVELLDTSREKLIEDVNALREQLGMEPIKLGVEVGSDGSGTVATAKQTEQAWGAAANAISAIGGALQQIEDPSAKVAGIVMQAVANIALGFAQAAASPATGAAGVFGWIAAATAGLATMISTIASIKSVTKGGFANGGIVPGNSFSGDNLHTSDYGINSGELILNRSQQNSIASQLQGGGINGLHLTTELSGENIRIALSNNARRRGGSRGEYAITH